uniref:NADPH-dependent F420 reductase n=1 Tax=Nocardioides sp. (strain JS1661) TaxID=1517491 RepID=A0A089MYS1_NOCS1|nr:NADPH-dependent F420 reductase [Nocardioides sp. JS1661]
MSRYKIAVIGGTGPQGRGLARWLVAGGHDVVIGSRSAERAGATAEEIATRTGADVSGADNESAARTADIVLVVVPWNGHHELITSLADALDGKLVVSCVNPLGFDAQGAFGLGVEEGSAAEQTQKIVPGARVVGAFHHLSAVSLWESEALLDHEDVLVCGDDLEAKEVVKELAGCVTGRPGVDAGALRLAAQLEPLTAVLININRRYKTRSGIAIVGIDR